MKNSNTPEWGKPFDYKKAMDDDFLFEFDRWMSELKQIANKWSPIEYPINSEWCLEYWYKWYASENITPQECWNNYTTNIK